MQLQNKKGEDLYLLVITESKEFNRPSIRVNTWEKVTKDFEDFIKEVDNESWLIKQVKVERNPEYHRMEATLLCNHKGWGSDFFRVITIESAYSF